MTEPTQDQPKPPENGKKPEKGPDSDRKKLMAFFLIPLLFFLVLQIFVFPNLDLKDVAYSEFYQMVLANPQTHQIASAELVGDTIRGKLDDGAYFQVTIPGGDPEIIPLVRNNIADFKVNSSDSFWQNLIYSVLPVLLLIGFFWFFVYRGMQQGGGKIFSFGKSKAKLSDKEKSKIFFKDVAGADEAKEELEEIIEFLKDPERFQKLGGRIPKGVLLMGPPGTGKTLMAKAVAGEAGVPFFSISGSDFVEMFVGVGASRVRDLFEQGKKAAQTSGKGAILFIDEIDAVGRQRFAGVGGGHDEREQTLNALLVEMDGFDTHTGVILIGSTNRPDVLDPALLRPGRFDRQVVMEKPDIKGREEILNVHAKKIKCEAGCDFKTIARQTPGFSGADLANLVNEAALLAARNKKTSVSQKELEGSVERQMVGPEKKSRVMSEKEREITAVHESGHALVAHLIPGTDPVQKVSIIPRRFGVGGFTLQVPIEDRSYTTKQDLLNQITILLGGRVAEEVHFKEVSSGASNDLERATSVAHAMVCRLGMSDRLGNVTYGQSEHQVFLGRDMLKDKDHSEKTAIMIDDEIRRIVDECHTRARDLVEKNIEALGKVSDLLLEKETIDYKDIDIVLGVKKSADPSSTNGKPSSESSPNQGSDKPEDTSTE